MLERKALSLPVADRAALELLLGSVDLLAVGIQRGQALLVVGNPGGLLWPLGCTIVRLALEHILLQVVLQPAVTR